MKIYPFRFENLWQAHIYPISFILFAREIICYLKILWKITVQEHNLMVIFSNKKLSVLLQEITEEYCEYIWSYNMLCTILFIFFFNFNEARKSNVFFWSGISSNNISGGVGSLGILKSTPQMKKNCKIFFA